MIRTCKHLGIREQGEEEGDGEESATHLGLQLFNLLQCHFRELVSVGGVTRKGDGHITSGITCKHEIDDDENQVGSLECSSEGLRGDANSPAIALPAYHISMHKEIRGKFSVHIDGAARAPSSCSVHLVLSFKP